MEMSANTTEPPPEGRVAKRRAQCRQRILDAAEQLVAEHGIDAVTVDAIAESADIARRSFYLHFESKNEVMIPIARERTKALNRRIDRLLEDIEDPAEVMATGIRYGLREISTDPLCRWFVLQSGLPQERLYEGMGESGARDVARAIEAGRFRVENDNIIRHIVSGAFLAVITARVEQQLDDDDLDDAVEYLLRMFGLKFGEAHEISHRPLRSLPPDTATMNAIRPTKKKTS